MIGASSIRSSKYPRKTDKKSEVLNVSRVYWRAVKYKSININLSSTKTFLYSLRCIIHLILFRICFHDCRYLSTSLFFYMYFPICYSRSIFDGPHFVLVFVCLVEGLKIKCGCAAGRNTGDNRRYGCLLWPHKPY